MTKILFVQEPSPRNFLDLSTARRFGEVHFMFGFKAPVSIQPEKHYRIAEEILSDFDVETDYLADCGGDKMALGVAVHILALRGATRINFLRWDRRSRSYEPSFIGPEPL